MLQYLTPALFTQVTSTDKYDHVEAEGKELQIAKETQKLNWYAAPLQSTQNPPYQYINVYQGYVTDTR